MITASHTRTGFSLVELSIVLVILGLLTGGILAGQSLIRAAELRSITTEYQRYVTATQTFRDKYFAIPGDMANATRFWGDDNTNCADAAIANGSPGTCNGNGDGNPFPAGGGGVTAEVTQFWKQLALAGLIEGSYTGISGAGGGAHAIIGTNVPFSKLSSAGWSVNTAHNYTGNGQAYAFDYGVHLRFGATVTNDDTLGAIIKPEEAWNIDTKLDDGRPGYGKIVAYYWNNACATGGASSADLTNSVYNLTSTNQSCALFFAKAF